jgi:hypothetical protein
MLHVPSGHLSPWPVPPKQINPPRASNGTPGVVIQDKTRGWLPGSNLSLRIKHRLLYLDERQPPGREETLISGNRTARNQDQPEIPLRALRNRTKEDVARIAVEDASRLLRVVTKIAA